MGECTMATSCEYRMIRQHQEGQPVVRPSEIFGYNRGVIRMGNPTTDSGLDGATMMDVNCLDGLPPNDAWPSEQHAFTEDPPDEIVQLAKKYCAKGAQKMSGLDDVFDCLANRKEPVFCAVILHQSFMGEDVAKTGIVPLPGMFDSQVGGHEMTAYYYRKNVEQAVKLPWYKRLFSATLPAGMLDLLNHWEMPDGTLWGDEGHAHIPLNYPDFIEFWRLII